MLFSAKLKTKYFWYKINMNPPIMIIDDSLDSILQSIESAKSKSRTSFPTKQIFIVSWNVNLLKKAASRDQFHQFISEKSPDILCFEETKITLSEQNRFKSLFPQYSYQYWSFSEELDHWAGLALLSKAEAHSIYHGIGTLNSTGRVLSVEFEDFFICVCYCPLSKSEEEQQKRAIWDEELRHFIIELQKRKNVIWIGDFNIIHTEDDIIGLPSDLIVPPGFGIIERKSFEKNFELGFVDSFRYCNGDEKKFSWRSIRMPGCPLGRIWKSRIDYALVSVRMLPYLKESIIFDDYKAVSDHCPIGVKFDFSVNENI
ncbi:unnamed protein product [Blepharisma stoltei]|uniref:Endonuclease/exonuclease/phosphatase domain-containing protein n=1 Tax=Blepharisma stoltei TaxID=1481888 RepID=A0AAU9K9A1_9CILI|nr:unnamed protein product [Blepharisma stoltei]